MRGLAGIHAPVAVIDARPTTVASLHCSLRPGYKEWWEPLPVECYRDPAASKSLLERTKSVLLDCSDSFRAWAPSKYLAA